MSIDTQADQRRHTHPAPPRMPPDVEPITQPLVFTHRPLSDVEVAVLRTMRPAGDLYVHEPDLSLHVISMALAAISGALVGFVIRGLL
ncbi:hypothetical protein CCR97_08105 [Rhodoplanes elegans]|uniref:Uncharacterized protein n=1 Tax=Rhodoplanes elegans TaxID=29408 RepID=A0A327KYH3_9BRAD|nr:hypothetical protein [Rhodoplanes elegans]MBK5958082.1 hypothetical protein [Rhodoplanes elegans]MBK5958174.1 hypothetical protein [Rhodoplanes elegans]RAI40458.1 hypothetical protein CH338_06350 [Rhodoplanes elegans]